MAVQSQYMNRISAMNIGETTTSVQRASKAVDIEQVIILLSGDKKDEYILAPAMDYARDNNAQLVIVHTYKSHPQEAELYLKGVKNKIKTQYGDVVAFLFCGHDKLTALQAVIDDRKECCVMMSVQDKRLFQKVFNFNNYTDLLNLPNVRLCQVERR